MERFLQILKEEEDKVLSSKTSWGRNDLKLVLAEAKNIALARYYEPTRLELQRKMEEVNKRRAGMF